MWHGMDGIGWGWLGLGILLMVVFWGLVILAFAALLRWLGGGRLGDAHAIDILKARYARGELTREEFEKLKRELAD